MKGKTIIGVVGSVVVLVAGYALLTVTERADQTGLFESIDGRQSITFIMGEDKTEQPFYRLASEHFALHPEERTDHVVHACRTLDHVIQYLNTSSQRGGQPWSVINIVAHGNPQTGLNLYIKEGGHKATPKRLVQAALRKDLPALQAGTVDSSTRINFWSCGIGKSPLINLALKQLFRTDNGDSARVYCSPHFVIFHPSREQAAPYRLKASYWPYYFRRGYRPGNLEIAAALRTDHPDANIDWLDALSREEPDSANAVYHGEYHIPVSYTRIYPSKGARPVFDDEGDKIRWALSQPALTSQIAETGIPADQFHWTVHKIIHPLEHGTRVPAVKAIGMATVLYILREDGTHEPKVLQ
ncbi:MAG: hypothetical protein R3301_13240 [Saprospiraceae bacterium]|nr:hypothetical protein [Saprospiraceae bacterium]